MYNDTKYKVHGNSHVKYAKHSPTKITSALVFVAFVDLWQDRRARNQAPEGSNPFCCGHPSAIIF